MDCCYSNGDGSLTIQKELPNISSPEMFDSDNEDDKNKETLTHEETTIITSPVKPSQADLVAKSDNNLLTRMNKLLTGVPPPPKHTICRTDCAELLLRIYENRQLFWTPCVLAETQLGQDINEESPEQQKENISTNHSYQRTKSTSRNLSTAFDACDPQYPSNVNDNVDTRDVKNNICSDNNRIKEIVPRDEKSVLDTAEGTMKVLDPEEMQELVQKNAAKQLSSASVQEQLLLYYTINEKEAATLTWPEAYCHKFHGIT